MSDNNNVHNFILIGPNPGRPGTNAPDQTSVPPQAPQGSAGTSHGWPTRNGDGGPGDQGYKGYDGGHGGNGGPGDSSGNGVFYVTDLFGTFTVSAYGRSGGCGGNGGNGGTGGQGGDGGPPGSGDGPAGNQGAGGTGGDGGDGGDGGNGGNGGNGGTVVLYASDVTSDSYTAQHNGGQGGARGTGGSGGTGGDGGGGHVSGGGGGHGDDGSDGSDGTPGIDGSITVKAASPICFNSMSPTSGPAAGGTAITINGGNFMGNVDGYILTMVKIGGMPVIDLTYVSDTQLTGITPALPAGQYQVTGENPDNSMAVMPTEFTYT